MYVIFNYILKITFIYFYFRDFYPAFPMPTLISKAAYKVFL